MKNEKMGVEDLYLAPEKENEAVNDIDSNSATQTSDGSSNKYISKKKSKRIEEIRELREKDRKVFRMTDGSEQTVFFTSPVHVFNHETQDFEDISSYIHEDADGKTFRNHKNTFNAIFSKDDSNNELFRIEESDHRIIVSSAKERKSAKKGIVPRMCKGALENNASYDIIAFPRIASGADYEYSVMGDGVKENIVIKEKRKNYVYPFKLHCENVIPVLDAASGRISFKDTASGEEIFFIPAPFMEDSNGIVSTSVRYDLTSTEEDTLLKVIADSDFINSENTTFPVVIDPQIKLSSSSASTTYSWNNGSLYSSSTHMVGTTGNGDGYCNARRMYMTFKMPTLPLNPRIKKAELIFKQSTSTTADGSLPKMGLYRVYDEILTGECTPIPDTNLIDYAKMKTGSGVTYSFDVTTLFDTASNVESSTYNLVLKMIDETNMCKIGSTIYGSSHSSGPQLVVTYESSYAVNSSYRTHTHELGRFGQGSVDLQCGNLMFESEDFTWSGNIMPVTINHLYNSALSNHQYTYDSGIKLYCADYINMKLGCGFKLNLMQSIRHFDALPIEWTDEEINDEELLKDGYIYIGERGEETYFKMSKEQVQCDGNSQCYYLYKAVDGSEMTYDPVMFKLTQGDNSYLFDTSGRLIKITDANENYMEIVYEANHIKYVTDGIGRIFDFIYNSDDYLSSIKAPDETEITYTYTDSLLTGISYPNGKKASIAYSSNKPESVTLRNADGDQVYKVAYTFVGDRLTSVTEYGINDTIGAHTTYSYSAASSRTVVTTTEQKDTDLGETEDNVITTTYTFDDDGNIVSEYVYSTDTGYVGGDGEASGINPHSGDGAGIVSNINNLLVGHSFEDLSAWSMMSGNSSDINIKSFNGTLYAKFGAKSLRMQSSDTSCVENGVYQATNILPKGQYTFSAYIRPTVSFTGTDAGAFIRVTDTSGNILGVSERLVKSDSDHTRLIVPFELNSAQSVQVQILVNGKGTIYADAAQLENNPYANSYNMLENGNFEMGTDNWECESGIVSYSTGTRFNMSKSLVLNGDIDSAVKVYQQAPVRTTRSTRETFTLSGWAKACSLPFHDRDGVTTPPTFRLRAVVKYKDSIYGEYGTEEFTADFSPCTDEWQFASVQFSKSKYRTVEYIRVYCDYSYNTGIAYFDDVQLIRNSLETSLSASDFVVESTGGSADEEIEEVEETTDTASIFEEAKDDFGNSITETTFTDGEFGTIYRSFGFTVNGNDLLRETDARGNDTEYTVNGDTSRNEEVIDRLDNKTAYEYDASGRTTKVTSIAALRDENGNLIKDEDGNIQYETNPTANVSYAYDTFDNMTEIVRGDGMKYALAYNEFHNLESIGIEGKAEKLIQYTYKNGNGRLKEMKYANGDTMKATYNSIGQMVAEKWYDSTDTLTKHYKYVYDGDGNIVRSIDIKAEKEYNYTYEEGRIIRATEAKISLSGEVVTSKEIVNTVKYYYNSDGNMTKKIVSVDDEDYFTYYETNDDGNTVVKINGKVVSHSKTDSFGRKEFDELQLGTDSISRQFVYHAGKVTTEHKEKAKVKSSATTQLVSQIIFSDGHTLSYVYDAEERIISVSEKYTVDKVETTDTTSYTYDALGQLLTETNVIQTIDHSKEEPVVTVTSKLVNSMEYDNYGNITKKNGVVYTYDTTWKDLLLQVGTGDDSTISYDAQGNPTSYLGHTLTWEKGRQLKSFDGNTYTYNANGIRTSKTVNGVLHTYTLDGTKILRETWGGNTLIPLYDNEDGVCGIIHNNIPYYFIKNLQGDVIAIVDKDAQTVARYSYDAWGVCTVTQDSVGIATINPFRYRGYYYDEEIELYYLQSRYYDAGVGRFLNADTPEQAVVSVGVFYINIFSYCSNKVTNNLDYSGEAFLTALLIGFAVGAVISGVSTIVKNKKKGKKWYDGLAISMLAGGVGGAISCITIPGVSTWVCAAIFGALGNLTTQVILGKIKSLSDVTSAILAGAAAGLLGNAAAKALNKFVSARFVKWTKSQQKNFLGKIGKITNRTLRDIRQAIKKNGGYKVIENAVSKVLDRYGYPTVVSAFVSSTATSV